MKPGDVEFDARQSEFERDITAAACAFVGAHGAATAWNDGPPDTLATCYAGLRAAVWRYDTWLNLHAVTWGNRP